jgi:hypothetical protein
VGVHQALEQALGEETVEAMLQVGLYRRDVY